MELHRCNFHFSSCNGVENQTVIHQFSSANIIDSIALDTTRSYILLAVSESGILRVGYGGNDLVRVHNDSTFYSIGVALDIANTLVCFSGIYLLKARTRNCLNPPRNIHYYIFTCSARLYPVLNFTQEQDRVCLV